MKTIEDIRHAKLLELIEHYGTIQALANAIDRQHSQVSQWKNRSRRHKGGTVATIDSDSARWIEQKTGRPRGWMDTYWPFVSIEPETLERMPPQVRGLVEAAMVAEIRAHEDRSGGAKAA